MIEKEKYEECKARALEYFEKAAIAVSARERSELEVADFGLGRIDEFGVELIIMVNTERVSAKEVVLFPGQICPQHYHPDMKGIKGKEETFRCRWGQMYLYTEGEPSPSPRARVPQDKEDVFTLWREHVLNPGDCITIYPGTPHWFQAGPEGAVFSEFGTHNDDRFDVFLDPEIVR
ncbi:MAG: hypothetical protein LBR87_00250 [Synergistaceae bacterium]|jgi:D-lyxose ketol-isomerase|nr:hypothetical protein [Synergistaceae bacterium]